MDVSITTRKRNLHDFYEKRNAEVSRMTRSLSSYCQKLFLIDASITGTGDLFPLFYSIHKVGGKVLLTNLTLQELYKINSYKEDASSKAARYILKQAATYPNLFHPVLITESFGSVDERLIRYCAKHKDEVVLITNDIDMTNNARMYYNVTVHYLRYRSSFIYELNTANLSEIKTLYFTRLIDGILEIDTRVNPNRKVSVFSNEEEHTNDYIPLHINDDIYVATKKNTYLVFCHYKMISLESHNNCKFIYSLRIYDSSDISNLPLASYKTFIRDARRQFNIN